jgi:hypothetical protein
LRPGHNPQRPDWLAGRRDSNLCISVLNPLASVIPRLSLAMRCSTTRFNRDAHVRILSPELKVLANSDFEMQKFESCRPRSLKNRAVPRGFADMSWSLCAEFANGGAIPAFCLSGPFLVSRFPERYATVGLVRRGSDDPNRGGTAGASADSGCSLRRAIPQHTHG